VGEGYISPEDLDKTVRDGLGLRWSFMGPFATIELNAPGGVADYASRYAAFYRRLAADPPAPAVWDAETADKVAAALGPAPAPEQRAARTEWRDRRLMALAAHKRQQPEPN
jgi:3-hydroxyacyl-CoA dehydrogenase